MKTNKQYARAQRIERNAQKAHRAVQKLQGKQAPWVFEKEEVRNAYRVAAEAILIYEGLIEPEEA